MYDMFTDCEKLTSLDLSGFSTSNIDSMSNLFKGCKSLTTIVFGKEFITSRVRDMSNMFANCASLSELNLLSFDTSSVTTMREMFSSCILLSSIDLSSFETNKCTDFSNMFASIPQITVKADKTKGATMIEQLKNMNNVIIEV